MDWKDLSGLGENDFVNSGAVAEQVVGQNLLYNSTSLNSENLFYWVRTEGNSSAELDFVKSYGRLVLPIEVKAGKTGTLKSLHQFVGQKEVQHAVRFYMNEFRVDDIETNLPNVRKPVKFKLHSLPLYFVNWLDAYVEKTIR